MCMRARARASPCAGVHITTGDHNDVAEKNRENPETNIEKTKESPILRFLLHVGHSYGKDHQINSRKAPWNYRGTLCAYNLSISLLENPQTPHFYDFWIFGRVLEPQNQLFLSFETPRIPQII